MIDRDELLADVMALPEGFDAFKAMEAALIDEVNVHRYVSAWSFGSDLLAIRLLRAKPTYVVGEHRFTRAPLPSDRLMFPGAGWTPGNMRSPGTD